MMWELYLEDSYRPLEEAIALDATEQHGDGVCCVDNQRRALNELYSERPDRFDELVLGNDHLRKQMVRYGGGRGNFVHPSCDYCYVYDEDDENFLPEDLTPPPPPPSTTTTEGTAGVRA